jgi:hypothetical protein
MSTWPNRGASGGPCGGLNEGESKPPTPHTWVRSLRSDSSQQASSKAGAVQLRFASLAVVSSREDFHLQDGAHAGRTMKKPPLGGHISTY